MIQTESLFNPTIVNDKTKQYETDSSCLDKATAHTKVRERKQLILFVFLHVSQGCHTIYCRCMQNVKYYKYVKHTVAYFKTGQTS